MSDAGGGSNDESGHWKFVEYQGSQDTQHTYTLTAPSSAETYEFSGIYMLDDMASEAQIAGQGTVEVGPSSLDVTGVAAGGIVVLAIALVFIFRKRLGLKL